MKFENIVVGTDFSEEAEVALRQAVDIARHTGGKLMMLHVGVVHERIADDVGPARAQVETYEKVLAECLAQDRSKLAELRERFDGQGVAISHAVVSGFADTALVEAASDSVADLLVVGTHGRTGIKRLFLGSIAERVARLASMPVLIARPGGNSAGGFRKILVPVDFSEPSRRALEAALALAADGAQVDVLHCWNLPALADAYTMPESLREEAIGPLVRDMEAETRQRGEAFLADANAGGVALSFDVVRDIPAQGIHDRAPGYDLIVTGSHGRRGVRRFLLGSVAEVTVRHAPCSVLVVHGAERAE